MLFSIRIFVFEISQMDLLGKIGVFKTPQGHKITTPTLFPVVDPKFQEITPKEMYNNFRVEGIITSAYLSKKRGIVDEVYELGGIHEWFDFPGVIMMDSGAYQLMLYGEVDIDEKETIRVQEKMRPDIGVPLDIPVLLNMNKEEVRKRVEETIIRMCRVEDFVSKEEILWTLPIQGGRFIDLQSSYISKIKKNNCLEFFGFFALGSVVPIMISYEYNTLIEMMFNARRLLPFDRPLHLFGAGHPMMFALATAIGYDTFDSAAYILMAKEGRYLTVNGTYLLKDLQEFPCDCPVCTEYTPEEIRKLDKKKRTELLAKHNLYVSMGEIRNIRQAIREGRLWDLVRERSRAHPKLYDAIENLIFDEEKISFISTGTPSTRLSTIRVYDLLDTKRPEVLVNGLLGYKPSKKEATVIVITEESSTYHIAQEYLKSDDFVGDTFVFHPIFGLVPIELADTYPFNQVMFTISTTRKIWVSKFLEAEQFLKRHYSRIIIQKNSNTDLGKEISNLFEETFT